VGEGVDDLGEGEVEAAEAVERRDLHGAGLAATKGLSAAKAAPDEIEVVVAVAAISQGGRAAVGSVFFQMPTGAVLHSLP